MTLAHALTGKTVLITGGAGFIGSHLAEALLQQGCNVRILDDFSTGKHENIIFVNKDQVIQASITDEKVVATAMQDVDIVFHEAAQTSVQRSIENPSLTNDVNALGTLKILEAARKNDVRRVILASSAAVYGNTGKQACTEDMLPSPRSPYAASKASAEVYCRMYHLLHGMHTICLRYFNVYGTRQDPTSDYAGVISAFASCFSRGTPPTLFGDGKQSRDFIHVRDIVQANMLAATSDAKRSAGECMNIASGRTTTINQLFHMFQELTGKTMTPSQKPERIGDIYYSAANIEKAKKILGFTPKIPLAEGLHDLCRGKI